MFLLARPIGHVLIRNPPPPPPHPPLAAFGGEWRFAPQWNAFGAPWQRFALLYSKTRGISVSGPRPPTCKSAPGTNFARIGWKRPSEASFPGHLGRLSNSFEAWGLGFEVWGLGLEVRGLGFEVWGLVFRRLAPKGWSLVLKVRSPDPEIPKHPQSSTK